MKTTLVALFACLLVAGLVGSALAEGGSTKTAIGWNGINVVKALNGDPQNVLTTSIHTGTPKDS